MHVNVTPAKLTWSLAEISKATGLSLGFLRNDVRNGRLSVRKFGRRVLVLSSELERYLAHGSGGLISSDSRTNKL
jgi:excisionase family DNA binding protein